MLLGSFLSMACSSCFFLHLLDSSRTPPFFCLRLSWPISSCSAISQSVLFFLTVRPIHIYSVQNDYSITHLYHKTTLHRSLWLYKVLYFFFFRTGSLITQGVLELTILQRWPWSSNCLAFNTRRMGLQTFTITPGLKLLSSSPGLRVC